MVEAHGAGYAIIGDPRPAVTQYIHAHKISEGTYPSLAVLVKQIADPVKQYGSVAKTPLEKVQNVRNDMYLASEAMRVLAKDKESELSAAEKKDDREFKKQLDYSTKFIPIWVKICVAIALGLGTMVGWKRIVITVGEKIGKTHLTYGQGAAAEIIAAATIGAADGFGLPVSTTHVLSSGIAGTMVANGSGMQWSTVRSIAMAWVLTLPAAMTLSGLLYFIFRQCSDLDTGFRLPRPGIVGAGQTWPHPPACGRRWPRAARPDQVTPERPNPITLQRLAPAVRGDRPRPLPRDADVARLQIRERQVHHRRHQGVGIGVVLIERRQTEIREDAHEPQIDLGAGRGVLVLAFVIGAGHLDLLVRQADADHAPDVPVEHRDVELEVEADQRPRADEAQEIRQHLLDRAALSDVLFAKPVNLDRVRLHAWPRLTVASKRALARMRLPRILTAATVTMSSLRVLESRRLAIDRNRLARRRRVEQKAVVRIAQSRRESCRLSPASIRTSPD